MLFNKKNRKIFAHFNAVASLPKHLALIITTTTTTTASQLQFVQSHHHFVGVVVVALFCCLFFIINAVRSLFCCFLFLQRALCYWLGTFFTGFSTFSMPHTDAHTHTHTNRHTHRQATQSALRPATPTKLIPSATHCSNGASAFCTVTSSPLPRLLSCS